MLSIRLCRREIRPDTGKTTEKRVCCKLFSEMTTQRGGFGQNSCTADKQACVFGSFEFKKRSVLKIFMIIGLNLQTV